MNKKEITALKTGFEKEKAANLTKIEEREKKIQTAEANRPQSSDDKANILRWTQEIKEFKAKNAIVEIKIFHPTDYFDLPAYEQRQNFLDTLVLVHAKANAGPAVEVIGYTPFWQFWNVLRISFFFFFFFFSSFFLDFPLLGNKRPRVDVVPSASSFGAQVQMF